MTNQGKQLSCRSVSTMPPPDRWEAYTPLGSVIPGTKFIAFKVPLKPEICRNLSEQESFTPDLLVERINGLGKTLGLVVDLTFTRKYYNGQSFTNKDIQYEKIFTAGHEVPGDDVVQRFVEVVDDFISRNSDEDVLIGVHCTHGINRTGYLVCRYMIEKMKIEPDVAISLFGEARGYPIERENYIQDLKQRPRPSDVSGGTGSTEGPWDEAPLSHTRWQNPALRQPVSDWQGNARGGMTNRRGGSSSRYSRGGSTDNRSGSVSFSTTPNSGTPHLPPNRFHDQGSSGGMGCASNSGQSQDQRYSRSGHLSPLDALETQGSSRSWGSNARSRHYNSGGHSSPLDALDAGDSNRGWGGGAAGWGSGAGWGSDARSGWSSHQQNDMSRDNRRWDSQGQQNRNSWNRPQRGHNRQNSGGGPANSYREDLRQGYRQSNPYSYNADRANRRFGSSGRADRDTNWREHGDINKGNGYGQQYGRAVETARPNNGTVHRTPSVQGSS